MTKTIFSSVPKGFDAFVLVKEAKKGALLYVTANESQMDFTEKVLNLIAPKVQVISYPAWDTVPYDRIAPSTDIVGEQITALCQMPKANKNTIILTTVSALMQRIAPENFEENTLTLTVGKNVSLTRLTHFLSQNGYQATDVVATSGEFAVRGEIVDIYPAGFPNPVRLDFFDDELESINEAFSYITGGDEKKGITESQVSFNRVSFRLFHSFILHWYSSLIFF